MRLRQFGSVQVSGGGLCRPSPGGTGRGLPRWAQSNRHRLIPYLNSTVNGGVQIRMKSEAVRFLSALCPKRPPRRLFERYRVRFCGTRGDTEITDEANIQLHLSDLSLSNTVSLLEISGVSRARSTIYNWVHKAELQPESGPNPDHVAVDETVIRLNDEQYWLYAAVDPETTELLHTTLEPTTTRISLTRSLLNSARNTTPAISPEIGDFWCLGNQRFPMSPQELRSCEMRTRRTASC